jgi:hypothetical protein
MYLYRIALLHSLLLVGCADKNTFYVDKNFTAEEREDIRTAATDWQIATKERMDLEFFSEVYASLSEPRREIIRAASTDKIVQERINQESSGFHDGIWPGERIVIIADRVRVRAWEDDAYRILFRRIARHEMGHHFRARHTDVAGSVMHPTALGVSPECIDSVSVDSYCQYNDGCNRSQLVGCSIGEEKQ